MTPVFCQAVLLGNRLQARLGNRHLHVHIRLGTGRVVLPQCTKRLICTTFACNINRYVMTKYTSSLVIEPVHRQFSKRVHFTLKLSTHPIKRKEEFYCANKVRTLLSSKSYKETFAICNRDLNSGFLVVGVALYPLI